MHGQRNIKQCWTSWTSTSSMGHLSAASVQALQTDSMNIAVQWYMAAWKYGVITARLIAMRGEQTLFFEQTVLRSYCIFPFNGSHRLDNTQPLWDYSLELHCKSICKHRPILIVPCYHNALPFNTKSLYGETHASNT